MSAAEEILLQLSKKLSKLKMPAEARKEVIEKLLTSPARKDLFEKVSPALEELVERPDVRRAYLFGSVTTPKEKPSDVDLLLRMDKSYFDKDTGAFGTEHGVSSRNALSKLHAITESRLGLSGEQRNFLKKNFKDNIPDVSDERVDELLEGHDQVRDILKRGKEKYGPDYKFVRIAGLTGAATGAGLLASGDSEAEASPIYDVLKAGTRAAKRAAKQAETSSTKNLAGKIFEGLHEQPIEKVTEHESNSKLRNLIFKGGDVREADVGDVAGLNAKTGRTKYADMFEEKQAAEQAESSVLQAYRGLSSAYERIRFHPEIDKKIIKQTYRDHYRHWKEVGGGVVPDALVEYNDRLFTIMQPYADTLEREAKSGAPHLKGFKVVERIGSKPAINLGGIWKGETEPLIQSGRPPQRGPEWNPSKMSRGELAEAEVQPGKKQKTIDSDLVSGIRAELEAKAKLKAEASAAISKGPAAFKSLTKKQQKKALEKEFYTLQERLLRAEGKTEGSPGWHRIVHRDAEYNRLEKLLEDWED